LERNFQSILVCLIKVIKEWKAKEESKKKINKKKEWKKRNNNDSSNI